MYMRAFLLLGRRYRYLYVNAIHMYLGTTAASVFIINSTVIPSHPSVLFLLEGSVLFWRQYQTGIHKTQTLRCPDGYCCLGMPLVYCLLKKPSLSPPRGRNNPHARLEINTEP